MNPSCEYESPSGLVSLTASASNSESVFGRRGDAGLLEGVLVVVEPVRVAEQRQRAAVALELGVVVQRLREGRRGVDARTSSRNGVEVDERVRGAELADVVGGERGDHVGGLGAAGPQRLVDLVVGDVADHLDVDVRVRPSNAVDVGLDRLHLAGRAPAVPEGDGASAFGSSFALPCLDPPQPAASAAMVAAATRPVSVLFGSAMAILQSVSVGPVLGRSLDGGPGAGGRVVGVEDEVAGDPERRVHRAVEYRVVRHARELHPGPAE